MNLMPGDLKKRLLWFNRAQWGLLALLVVLGGAVYLFGIAPACHELDQVHGQYAAAQSELNQDQDRAKNLPMVEQDIERLRQRVERFDKQLPPRQDLASFIDEVTLMSRQASLHKLAWHLDSKPRQSNQCTELPVQITFEGDFETGVLAFLRGTEDMRRLTRVRKLELISSDAHDGQVRAELTMNIYFGEQ